MGLFLPLSEVVLPCDCELLGVTNKYGTSEEFVRATDFVIGGPQHGTYVSSPFSKCMLFVRCDEFPHLERLVTSDALPLEKGDKIRATLMRGVEGWGVVKGDYFNKKRERGYLLVPPREEENPLKIEKIKRGGIVAIYDFQQS